MNDENALKRLREITKLAAFNTWLGLEIESVTTGGDVELRLPWRAEFGQYNGYMHAAIVGGLIDTACGFACATALNARVLASQFAIRCLRPAVAEVFVARGKVVKLGRQQCFASGELYALGAPDKPFAVGDAVMVPIPSPA